MESQSSSWLIPLIVVIVVLTASIFAYRAIRGVYPASTLVESEVPVSHNGLDPEQARFYFFYTTWCPHSRKAEGPWKSLKTMFQSQPRTYGGKSVLFEEVNCEADEGKAAVYKVRSYPTFKVETQNKVYEFVGAPNTSAFRAFLISALGPEEVA